MTLIRFEPLGDIDNLQNRLHRYFGDFSNTKPVSTENFSPRIDIMEQGNNLLIYAEIPGVKKDELKITLQDNILTIQGEKKKFGNSEEYKFFRRERNYGTFKRCFTLPVEVDSNNVDAHFEDGILQIKMNKYQEKPVEEKIIKLN